MVKHNVIAIDLAKNIFQVCTMNDKGQVTLNKSIRRSDLAAFIGQQPISKIAMEACYSSHYWARIFQSFGHTVVLLPAQHVAPFVRGNKSDHNDAVAIAEAAHRPNILPVPIKSESQQAIQAVHRIRERYVSTRTRLMNQTRGILSEFGIICPQGHAAFCALLHEIMAPEDQRVPALLKSCLGHIADEYYALSKKTLELEKRLKSLANQNDTCSYLLSVPGIGVINATAIYSAIGRGEQFKSGREFAAWLGLTPRQSSSGGSVKTSGITKRGNRYLRKQLVHGARAILSRSKNKNDSLSLWANRLIARRGIQKATVAMAAKMARIAWVLLQKSQCYQTKIA